MPLFRPSPKSRLVSSINRVLSEADHNPYPIHGAEAEKKAFKVVSVSKNTNNFGLHGVILISKDGLAFEVGKSMSGGDKWATGDVINVPATSGRLNWAKIGAEIPRELDPPPPPAVVKEVWGS